MKNSYEDVCAALKRVQSVLIFAHKNPDGDAIGSSIAMGLALKSIHKKVDYAVDYDTKKCYALFNESQYFNVPLLNKYDVALVLDCSTRDYVHHNELLSLCSEIILLDHHRTNEGFADVGVIEADSAATGEIVYNTIKQLGVPFTREMANAVYVSIVEDTGNFMHSNTSARTHQITSQLYQYSDDLADLSYTLKCYDKTHLQLMNRAMQAVTFYKNERLGMIVLDEDNCEKELLDADTNGLIDLIRYLQGCVFTVLIKQNSLNEYKVSMRSSVDSVDVSVLAQRMHGGGHKRAAGFTYTGKLEDVKQIIIHYADELWTD